MPYSSRSCSTSRSPCSTAATWESTSPCTISGTRTFLLRMRQMASLLTPSSKSLMGGRRRPSWYISVLSQALPPATRPPMSVW